MRSTTKNSCYAIAWYWVLYMINNACPDHNDMFSMLVNV